MLKGMRRYLNIILPMICVFSLPISTYAEEDKTVEIEYISAILETVTEDSEEDYISVELPIIPDGNESIFDFILDPQGLINATNAVRHGGQSFEAGTTLYFKNETGAWDYSSQSDYLTINNHSNVPVNVRIEAVISNFEGITFVDSPEFSDNNSSIYMALVDDNGTEIPIGADGRAEISLQLEAESEIIYSPKLNEDTGEYEIHELEIAGDSNVSYSFGLTGICNWNGEWENIDEVPFITVVWYIVPEYTEDEALETLEESLTELDEENTDADEQAEVDEVEDEENADADNEQAEVDEVEDEENADADDEQAEVDEVEDEENTDADNEQAEAVEIEDEENTDADNEQAKVDEVEDEENTEADNEQAEVDGIENEENKKSENIFQMKLYQEKS